MRDGFVGTKVLTEVRCAKCDKLLGKVDNLVIQKGRVILWCHRCKRPAILTREDNVLMKRLVRK